MTIVSAHKCDIGLNPKRQNEDYIWVDEQAGLFIVADGMGGQEAGDVASKLAVETIATLLVDQTKNKSLSTAKIKELVTQAIETANETVYKASQKAAQKRRMGSTVIMALIQNSTAYISHAGDSRAYLLQGSSLSQLTEDDSWQTEFGAGQQTKGNGRKKVIDHILTKSIGQESKVDPSFTELKLNPGGCLLLCTDGLWGMIEDDQILAILKQAKKDPTKAVEALVDAANAAGGDDNISVVVIWAK